MNCPDCDTEMTEGFLPDTIEGASVQSHWHAGPVKPRKFLGMPNGVQVHSFKTLPLTAYRCADCGLVRLYALANNE